MNSTIEPSPPIRLVPASTRSLLAFEAQKYFPFTENISQVSFFCTFGLFSKQVTGVVPPAWQHYQVCFWKLKSPVSDIYLTRPDEKLNIAISRTLQMSRQRSPSSSLEKHFQSFMEFPFSEIFSQRY